MLLDNGMIFDVFAGSIVDWYNPHLALNVDHVAIPAHPFNHDEYPDPFGSICNIDPKEVFAVVDVEKCWASPECVIATIRATRGAAS